MKYIVAILAVLLLGFALWTWSVVRAAKGFQQSLGKPTPAEAKIELQTKTAESAITAEGERKTQEVQGEPKPKLLDDVRDLVRPGMRK